MSRAPRPTTASRRKPAVELIAEHGAKGFSLAEASRRLGIAASAPYRHFADREELLVAAAVRGCQVLQSTQPPPSLSTP